MLLTRCLEKFAGSLDPRKTACWTQFDCKATINARRQSLELEKDELDLVILGNVQAGRASPDIFPTDPTSSSSSSLRTVIHYSFGGKRICQSTFMFLYAVGYSCLENLIKHYLAEGIPTRVHQLS